MAWASSGPNTGSGHQRLLGGVSKHKVSGRVDVLHAGASLLLVPVLQPVSDVKRKDFWEMFLLHLWPPSPDHVPGRLTRQDGTLVMIVPRLQ